MGLKKKTSRYRGVSWCKVTSRWRTDISLGNKSVYVGLYKTQIAAAKAYNVAAKIVQGRGFKLNKF